VRFQWVNVSSEQTTIQPAAAVAATGTLDASYTLTSTLTCGVDQVKSSDTETLTVQSGQATITFPISGTFQGPIVVQGDAFTFDVTQADQYTTAHLEGTITRGGDVIAGTGNVGQGTRMSNCEVVFTGQRGPAGATTTTPTTPTTTPTTTTPTTTSTTTAGPSTTLTGLPAAADCTAAAIQAAIDRNGGGPRSTAPPPASGYGPTVPSYSLTSLTTSRAPSCSSGTGRHEATSSVPRSAPTASSHPGSCAPADPDIEVA